LGAGLGADKEGRIDEGSSQKLNRARRVADLLGRFRSDFERFDVRRLLCYSICAAPAKAGK
jgi:hypothetical protein